ncbi:proline iminopeptidase-family hydrolase [Glacieibacterium sp.]|uniref:proline iminopeptidase-family hydrolase n=1 Tax=Glacieibacterium sp. TaxID=2860237 RepID=UPI003AFF8B28
MNESVNFDRRAALGLLGAVPLLAAASPERVAPEFRADRELRVPARGGKLYVRTNGLVHRSRAPLLFIHGGPGSSHWYFLPALALADERPVILYDQLDSGRSQIRNDPANWTVERFVSEIDSIRGELGLDRLHIVGKSWGGAIAIEYAARRPAGLLSLTLAGPLVSTRSWEASTRKRLTELPRPVAEAIRRHERDGSTASPEYRAAIQLFYAAFDRRRPVPPGIAAYRDALPMAFNPRLYTTMWGPGETAASGSLRFYNAEPLLPRLAVPVMFLTGEYDEMMPSEIALLARLVPDAVTRIVPGAGHSGCLDNPEDWVGEVRRFTNRYG